MAARSLLGVRGQIAALCVLFVAFLVVLFVLAMMLQRISLQSLTLSRSSAGALVATEGAYSVLTDVNRELQNYTRTRDPAVLRAYAATKAAAPAKFRAVLESSRETPAQRSAARRYVTDLEAVFPIVDRYIAGVRAGHEAQARAAVSSPRVRRILTDLLAAKTAVYSSQVDVSRAHQVALRQREITLNSAMLAVTAGGVIFSLGLALLFGLRTVRRLRQLVANAGHLARREPTHAIGGSDEIADVNDAMHDLARRLEESLALQVAFIPTYLPDVGGLRFDAVYVPAASESQIGGDWYDVFRISESLVGISVGDVSGHGLPAASTMASLREAIRVTARFERKPSTTLQRVNELLCMDHPGALATALFGIFDTTDGSFCWASAGHPPPMLVCPEGGLTVLPSDGLVLGVDARYAYAENETVAGVGSALVFYTDGLVEVDREYSHGLAALQAAVAEAFADTAQPHPAAAICDRIFAKKMPNDDAALLFMGITQIGAPVYERKSVWHVDARDAASARRVKRAILWKLSGLAGNPEYAAIELVYGELLANAAMHTPGPAAVSLEERDGTVILSFEDRGPAFTPPAANGRPDVLLEGGRGYWLISQFAQTTTVERIADRNRVTVTFRREE